MFQHILTLLNVNIHTHIHTYTSICLKGSYLINNSSLVSLYNSPWAPLSFSFLDYYTFLFCILKKKVKWWNPQVYVVLADWNDAGQLLHDINYEIQKLVPLPLEGKTRAFFFR